MLDISRRDFLKFAGKTVVVSSALFNGCTIGDWMAAEKIQMMNSTESEREAMLHGNARKLLRI